MNIRTLYRQGISLAFLLVCLPTLLHAAVVDYDLAISTQEVNFTGKDAAAMTVNGGIPGPLLHFTEGDKARIRVHNQMDVDTSIHWHGLLVPPGMDGVPYVSFPPIAPGETFTYEFALRQSGTYWYHSHTNLQEQRGVYGAIVIQPKEKGDVFDREHTILFSDWTDEDPNAVLRTLKRGSEWYAVEKGSAQSIFGAAHAGRLGAYYQRELLRMPPMDISDVAYDLFLANGEPETTMDAASGETIRLRIVNGSATTYFHLDFAGGPMTIISADGQDVEPVEVDRLLIAVAETYDLVVKIPSGGAHELRATAHDASGFATVWLGKGNRNFADPVPYPDLYHSMGRVTAKRVFALMPSGSMGMSDHAVESGHFDHPGMMGMEQMSSSGEMMPMEEMGHGGAHGEMRMEEHQMPMGSTEVTGKHEPSEGHFCSSCIHRGGKRYGSDFHPFAPDISSRNPRVMDGMDAQRPWPPYDKLRATQSTAFPKEENVRVVRLTLDGDMDRYVWLLNNRPLSESDVIPIKEGEVVRFVMINRTMMHHPMHLHGHFFRVINAQGDHSPLKHTVNVAPMSTTVIEFYGGETGDWFFHCHLLYHMKSGMARLVHYEGYDPGEEVNEIRSTLNKDSWYAWAEAQILTNMTEGYLRASNTRNILTGKWEVGWGKIEETDWEATVTWDRYFNRFIRAFIGGNFEGENSDTEKESAILGLRYLLPLNLESRLWVDTDADVRVMLEKHFELSPRFMLGGEVEYDSAQKWEGSIALDYLIQKAISVTGKWHSEFGWGAGLTIRI